MRTSAAEYFASLSPVKDDRHGGRPLGVGAQGGRCHCCPYGYHIDLDFVRYCHTLAKGCEQESATLRKLKQTKRQRRRETHSMEVMLGLTSELKQTGVNGVSTPKPAAPPPPPRGNSLKHLHDHLINQQRHTDTTTSSCSTNILTPRITDIVSFNVTSKDMQPSPPPDVVRMANNDAGRGSCNAVASAAPQQMQKTFQSIKRDELQSMSVPDQRPNAVAKNNLPAFTEASNAFQEAMLDFEEILESSHESAPCSPRPRSQSASKAPPPSLDLLQHSHSRNNTYTDSNIRESADRRHVTANSHTAGSHYATPQRKQGIGSIETGSGKAGGAAMSGMGTAMASILAQSAVNRVRSACVTRSNSLPRYCGPDSPPSEHPLPACQWGDGGSHTTFPLLLSAAPVLMALSEDVPLEDDVFVEVGEAVPDESPHAAWFSRFRPNGNNTASGPGPAAGGGAAPYSYQPAATQPLSGVGRGMTLREALASLEAARGSSGSGGGMMMGSRSGVCSPPPFSDDVMSVTSAVSQLSTSTLQSIRDQMATGLSRLKELEAEVRNIPHLQRELALLREEKRQMQRVGAPNAHADDRSEDEVEVRGLLSSSSGGKARRRSPSPVRVNLEEFCSYRRARAGSTSDCSDSESVNSERRTRHHQHYSNATTNHQCITSNNYSSNCRNKYSATNASYAVGDSGHAPNKNSLFISESNDYQQQKSGVDTGDDRKIGVDRSVDAVNDGKIGVGRSVGTTVDDRKIDVGRSVGTTVNDGKIGVGRSVDTTVNDRTIGVGREGDDVDKGDFKLSRRHRRDVSTSCKVLTRDVATNHAARVRSVGLMADLLPPSRSPSVVSAQKDLDRNRSPSPMRELKRPALPNLFSMTRSTQTIEDKVDGKSSLLSQLGQQSSSVLSIIKKPEIKKESRVIVLDCSTNTDVRALRTQGVNTDQHRTRDQRSNTTLTVPDVMTRDDVDVQVIQRVKLRVQEAVSRARQDWELELEDALQERLRSKIQEVNEKYRREFERDVAIRVNEKIGSEMARARHHLEQDIQDEIDCKVTAELTKAKQAWKAAHDAKAPVKPQTRDRSVQVLISQPDSIPEKRTVKAPPPPPSVRSVAAGEGRITDVVSDKCCMKSVGCSWDKITDVVCDECKGRKFVMMTKPITKGISVQTIPPVVAPTVANSSQTASVSSKTVATNTTALALKKEEPVVSAAASPALTPEVERRPFGSSGVKICDKCHETITSVAKDIVGTSTGSASSLAVGPPVIIPLPLTGGSSKIPRLVDVFKLEPRLDVDDVGPLFFRRDSELRHSDSRIDQLSSRVDGDTAVLRRHKDQTPDLLSDTRRNSGPPSTETLNKAPFIRQQTYTKLEDTMLREVPAGVISKDHHKSGRKMSAFAEEDEDEIASKSRKSSAGSARHLYRRERSSPEISFSNRWKRQQQSAAVTVPTVKPDQQQDNKQQQQEEVQPHDQGDDWQREMTSYSQAEDYNRTSRSTSVESNATYIKESVRRSTSPSSPRRGPSPPCSPRKLTPIPVQAPPPPPPNFPTPPPSLQAPSTATQMPLTSIHSTSVASDQTPSTLQKPQIPATIRITPYPASKQASASDSGQDSNKFLQQQTSQPPATPPLKSQQEPQQHAAPLAQPQDMRLSTTSVDESEILDSCDESVVTQDSSVYGPTSGASPTHQRKKTKLGRNLRAALKVLNDSIGKPVRSGQQLTNALNIIQREWFKVSSQQDVDPHLVEDYLDIFEMQYSRGLLHRVVNLTDVSGNTAMHYAVSHGNFDVVSLLLDSKVCSMNQQNKAGYTATMLVSLAPIKCPTHASVVERLFSMSDVNVKADQHGQTALMLAVSHGRLDTVRLLLAAGADVNIQDDDGSTALMCAAEHGHLAIVRFLLQCPDTDAHLVDNDGSSALTIAVEAGHKDVGVLLYKHVNLARGSSPYSSLRGSKRSRTPTLPRSTIHTPPARFSAPPSPGRSRRSSGPPSPPSSHHNSPHTARHKPASASLSNLNF